MIKYIISIVLLMALSIPVAKADHEEIVKLDRQEHKTQTFNLGYAAVTFDFITLYDNKARVTVKLENVIREQSIYIFRNDKDENMLKRLRPKVEFAKTFGGDKGSRSVKGCSHVRGDYMVIPPSASEELFTIDASVINSTVLELPLYIVAYRAKKFLRSEKNEILQGEVIRFILDVEAWSELDPTYVDLFNAVHNFRHDVKEVKFCRNRLHRPSLDEQMAPYKHTQDSLVAAIDSVLMSQPQWMSQDEPHQYYTRLRDNLTEIDLETHLYDCGKHKQLHRCSYCSLTAEQIFHRLDDTYQQLHTGRMTKEEAVRTARSLYNCYRQNGNRRRDNFYGGKIVDYYDRISKF